MGLVVPINELTSFSALRPPSNPPLFETTTWRDCGFWCRLSTQLSATVTLPNTMEGVSNKLVNSARVAHTIKQPLDQPEERGGREMGMKLRKKRTIQLQPDARGV